MQTQHRLLIPDSSHEEICRDIQPEENDITTISYEDFGFFYPILPECTRSRTDLC